MPDEGDAQLVGFCDHGFVLRALRALEYRFADEPERKADGCTGPFSRQDGLQLHSNRGLPKSSAEIVKVTIFELLFLRIGGDDGCVGGLESKFRVRAVTKRLVR